MIALIYYNTKYLYHHDYNYGIELLSQATVHRNRMKRSVIVRLPLFRRDMAINTMYHLDKSL